MNFVYANEDHSTIINEKNGVVFITFPKLVKAGICHGFSTRIGGVSEGHLSSMNLSFTRGDDPEKVQENFRRIGAAIGFDAKDLVLSSQIHLTLIVFHFFFMIRNIMLQGWHIPAGVER